MSKYVLGIDPSIGTPCGVVLYDRTCHRVIDRIAIHHAGKTPPQERMVNVVKIVRLWLVKGVVLCGIEDPPMVTSVSTHATLQRLVGALQVACADAGVRSVLCKPTEGKQALTGKGNATKEQMVAMAAHEPGMDMHTLKTKADREAVADALGIVFAAWNNAWGVE